MERKTEQIISYIFNHEIRFEYFESLYLLLIIPLLLIIQILYNKWRRKKLFNLITTNLHSQLILFNSTNKNTIKIILKISSICLIIMSLSQPQLFIYKKKEIGKDNQKETNDNANGIEIMLALDISYSMICRDVNLRNRLYKSKETLKKLIKQLRKHKIGLVVFAGKAFTLVPLTNDHNFLNNTISTVDTGMINIQGTNISECINRSISSFNFNNKLNKCIVIISDGGDHVTNEIDSMLKNTNKERVFIQTISIGSKKGGLIPVSNKEEPYIKDINDKYVTTRTNIKFLKDLAQKGNGIHINMETENIASLIKQINGIEGSNYKKPIILVKKTEIELKKEKDLYIYLLLIAFIIILSDLFLIRGSNDTKFQET